MRPWLLVFALSACSSEPAKREPSTKEKALAVAQQAARQAEHELEVAQGEADKAKQAMEAAKQELDGVMGEHAAAKQELGKLRREVLDLRDKATKRILELDEAARTANKQLASASTNAAKDKARAFVEKVEAERIMVTKALGELDQQVKRIDAALDP